MREHRINFGQGAQTFRTIAVADYGGAFPVRPSAATFQIVDLRYSDTDANYSVTAPAAASIDAVNTTTTAACGRSSSAPSLITLTTVASVAAGRRYLLRNASGQHDLVTAVDVATTPKTVRALTEPLHSFPTASTFQGIEVTATVPDTIADDDEYFGAELRVLWTFTGVDPARVIETIRVVRPPPSWLTVDDLLRLEPFLANRMSDLESAVAQAHQDIGADLRSAGIDPHTHDPGEVGRNAAVYRAAYLALMGQENDAARERAASHLSRYRWLSTNLSVGRDKPGVTQVDPATGSRLAPDIRSLFSGL
jgi:hypothetical protein